jgi:CheY-like chemotaxis protein
MGSHELKDILLVEDNSNDVELILMVFQKNRIANQVVVVRDGTMALEYLYREEEFALRKEGNPAVILLDLKTPRDEGLEVLRRVKSDARLKTIPVVILTSSLENRDLVEGYFLGANAYVVKPVHFREFVEVVSHLGIFWTRINEPPPEDGGERAQSQSK